MYALSARQLATLFGGLLALAGALFVLRALAGEWPLVLASTRGMRSEWLGGAFFFGFLGMSTIGLGWHKALDLVGVLSKRRAALRWYFVGQLGKYVPGGIWGLVGSVELAVGGGTSRARGYGAMLLALGATYLAGVVTVAALLPLDLGVLRGAPSVGLLLLLAPAGVMAVHPVALERVRALARRLSPVPIELEVPTWGASLWLVGRHVPAWVGIGLATWFVTQALVAGGTLQNVMLASVLAWVVGFLVVPAPGGLGVREAVFVATATSLSPGMAAAVAIVSRVLFILVDVLGAVAMVTFEFVSGRRPCRAGEAKADLQPTRSADPDQGGHR